MKTEMIALSSVRTVAGTIVPRDPEFVQLDPCLHRLPDEDHKK